MSELNNIIASKKVNFNKKDLDIVNSQINDLSIERKNTNKQLFKETGRSTQLKELVNKREDLKAGKQGKIIIDINGEKFKIKESYLKNLKDPSKYVFGLYARKIRSYQKAAYKNKNFSAASSLEKKLNKLNQKQGLSKWKLTRSVNLENENIIKAFKSMGKVFDPKKINDRKSGKSEQQEDENYKPIITIDEQTGIINILLI